MALKIAINGFGRIGRSFLRSILNDPEATSSLQVVAINQGPTKTENLDLLFKYDSIMKTFPGSVHFANDILTINDQQIKILAQADPSTLPWKEFGIDWVIEASGRFTSKEDASKHLTAGSKKVLITAPSQNPDITIIPGVNDTAFDSNKHTVVSLGSCTTNCFALIVKVIKETVGLEQGLMTTTHAYTNDQVILDVGHKDPRRARAAGINIVPTKTGADKVITTIFPELEGKLKASALRVPVPIVSIVDFTFISTKKTNADEINEAFKKYAQGQLKNFLHYAIEPLVSSDYAITPYSAIFDSLLTQSLGTVSKVFAWYDNEYGYSSRLKDFLLHNR